MNENERTEERFQVSPILKTLVDLIDKSIINSADENGNRVLHVAAGLKKPSVIQFLISKGADKSLKNKKGQTALDCLEYSSYDDFKFRSAFGIASMSRPLDTILYMNSASVLMPPEISSKLIDGWLSPRMIWVLDCTLQHEIDEDNLYGRPQIFQKFKPASLEDCCGFDGIRRIDYIPGEVLEQNSEGFYKSFADGWEIAWKAMHLVVSRREAPTISRVQHEITNRMGCDLRKWNHFTQKGGKVEYAIDALLKITQNVVIDGDDGWEYCIFEDEIEAILATPFDKAFDIARVKCLELTNENFMKQPQGPYYHGSNGLDRDDFDY